MMTTKRKTTPRIPEPHWDVLVQCWFAFYREKKGISPSFDGSAPRDLRLLISSLRKRAQQSDVRWTQFEAVFRFPYFLSFAYKDKWLQDHWLLFNLNRQKDRIFTNLRSYVSQPQENPFD